MTLTAALIGVCLGQQAVSGWPDFADIDAVVVLNHPDEPESVSHAVKGFETRLVEMRLEGYRLQPIRVPEARGVRAFWAYRPAESGLGQLSGLTSVFQKGLAGKELDGGSGLVLKLSELDQDQLRSLEQASNATPASWTVDDYRILHPTWDLVFEAQTGYEYRVPISADFKTPFRELPKLPNRPLARAEASSPRGSFRSVLTRDAVNLELFSRVQLGPAVRGSLKVAAVGAYEAERARVITDYRNSFDAVLSRLGTEMLFLDDMTQSIGGNFEGLPVELQSTILMQRGRVPEFRSMTDEEVYDKLASMRIKAVRGRLYVVSAGDDGTSWFLVEISRGRG